MTEELKKALEAAKTEEEKKAVAEKFKEEIQKLNPEELDKVAGGCVQNVPVIEGRLKINNKPIMPKRK